MTSCLSVVKQHRCAKHTATTASYARATLGQNLNPGSRSKLSVHLARNPSTLSLAWESYWWCPANWLEVWKGVNEAFGSGSAINHLICRRTPHSQPLIVKHNFHVSILLRSSNIIARSTTMFDPRLQLISGGGGGKHGCHLVPHHKTTLLMLLDLGIRTWSRTALLRPLISELTDWSTRLFVHSHVFESPSS